MTDTAPDPTPMDPIEEPQGPTVEDGPADEPVVVPAPQPIPTDPGRDPFDS